MAIMIPSDPPTTGPGKKAEGALFRAFAQGLGDDWHVYYSLHLLHPRGAREGEADFLLVHPTKGILLVECKGTGVECRGDGYWYRMVGGHRKKTKEPMAQAQKTSHSLRELLDARVKRIFGSDRRLPLMMGHAVAFPLASRTQISVLPLNWDHELLFDCDDLIAVEAWVDGALKFWRGRQTPSAKPFSADEFNRFRKKVLHPELKIIPSLRGQLSTDKQVLLQLSEEQRDAGTLIQDTPRLNILGGAGTGKTLAALEGARLLAQQGLRVLLLCYNRALAEQLKAAVSDLDVPEDTLITTSFHGLCAWASQVVHHRPLAVPKAQTASAFWTEEAYKPVLDALTVGRLQPFDAIIVDEGQDFFEEWWLVVDELLRSDGPKRLYVFHDPGQAIFEHGNAVPTGPTIRFSTNFRNTKAMAEVIVGLAQIPARPHLRAPKGDTPSWSEVGSAAKLVRRLGLKVDELVQRGVPAERMVVLTVHSKKNSPLKGVRQLGGRPLVSLKKRKTGAVTHATIASFKGLEADVVFCVEADGDDPLVDRSLRYVAASRGRHLFFLYSQRNWLAASQDAV